MRLAIALQSRIKRGAFDTLRKPRAPRLEYESTSASTSISASTSTSMTMTKRTTGSGHPKPVKSYLDLPFGEVVALICEGIGMTPDWDAWACEPWAQEEIKTQPAGSPYVGYRRAAEGGAAAAATADTRPASNWPHRPAPAPP